MSSLRGELIAGRHCPPRRPSNPTTSHLDPALSTKLHRCITTSPNPSLDFTSAAPIYLPTASNNPLVQSRAHTVTSRSCFGNIPLLLLWFTLSLSCVSQLRRSGRPLDALESSDNFFYKHQPSAQTSRWRGNTLVHTGRKRW